MQNATAEMNIIPKEAFQKWKDQWTKRVEMPQGVYFEGGLGSKSCHVSNIFFLAKGWIL